MTFIYLNIAGFYSYITHHLGHPTTAHRHRCTSTNYSLYSTKEFKHITVSRTTIACKQCFIFSWQTDETKDKLGIVVNKVTQFNLE